MTRQQSGRNENIIHTGGLQSAFPHPLLINMISMTGATSASDPREMLVLDISASVLIGKTNDTGMLECGHSYSNHIIIIII